MNLRDDAARWEAGTQNMVGMIGLGASIGLLTRLGLRSDASPIAEQVLRVADHLCDRLREIGATLLSPHDGSHRSGIVTFEPPGPLPPQQVRKRLLEAGVVTSCRGGGLRAAPHGYANEDDLERLIAGLLECRTQA
jgi:selenocysteine lyase/cysteine desulfurase